GESVGFDDDGPGIDENCGENLLGDNTGGGDSASGDLDVNGGNDLVADMTIVGAPDTNGFTFSYDNADHDSITGQLNGDDLYTLSVNDDGGYTSTMIGELAASSDHLDVNDIKAG